MTARRDDHWLLGLLGPVPQWSLLEVEVVEEVLDDGFLRRHMRYDVLSGRASAVVCVPDGLAGPAPLVHCHHQHAGTFDLGKSEVLGLRGHPERPGGAYPASGVHSRSMGITWRRSAYV